MWPHQLPEGHPRGHPGQVHQQTCPALDDDAPGNKLLQNYRVPNIKGGEVDCLRGIKYSILHPEPLHTLATSGLSIYNTKLKSHDGKINARIEGRHESFELFGVENPIQSFTAGLQMFRDGAMPRILGNPVAFEEIENA